MSFMGGCSMRSEAPQTRLNAAWFGPLDETYDT